MRKTEEEVRVAAQQQSGRCRGLGRSREGVKRGSRDHVGETQSNTLRVGGKFEYQGHSTSTKIERGHPPLGLGVPGADMTAGELSYKLR